jgi:hypothetical protein
MAKAAFPVLIVPFNGTNVSVQVRALNFTQIRSCGDFSIFAVGQGAAPKAENDYSTEDLAKIVNSQEALVKATLVCPTYDEILSLVYKNDTEIIKFRERAEEIKKEIEAVKSEAKKAELLNELEGCELMIGYLLPSDFTAAIVSWALDIERGEIKKITEDMLLEAAILAAKGHDNPADHLTGNFTDFHKDQINKSAWLAYGRLQKQKDIERKAGVKGFLMPKR